MHIVRKSTDCVHQSSPSGDLSQTKVMKMQRFATTVNKPVLGSKGTDSRLRIIEVAEQLVAQVGHEKTTVFDIARQLNMSSANVYRFFSSRTEINEAVGRHLLSEVEKSFSGIVNGPESASEKLRALVATVEKANADRFMGGSKLHSLLERAFKENWPIAKDHIDRPTTSIGEIISLGVRYGELATDDSESAAILVRSACIQFWHPRLFVDRMEEPEPTLDQMMNFCLASLTPARPTSTPVPSMLT